MDRLAQLIACKAWYCCRFGLTAQGSHSLTAGAQTALRLLPICIGNALGCAFRQLCCGRHLLLLLVAILRHRGSMRAGQVKLTRRRAQL